jgi:two-component system chemotaxis response regulator CheB
VVIGASAGAVEALTVLLPVLPRTLRVPVIVVVHLPPDRESALPALFQGRCALTVKEAEDKEELAAGVVYFAPPNYHLLVEPSLQLALSSEEPVLYSRPSIDLLFLSAADAYGPDLLGIVLTGANSDGARGLRAVCDAGGAAVVQSPQTALVPTMPLAALAACPAAHVLGIDEIARTLENALCLRSPNA